MFLCIKLIFPILLRGKGGHHVLFTSVFILVSLGVCFVFVLKVTSGVFCAIGQHNKAVPVLWGLAGSSGWVHPAVWCHQAGLVSLLEPALLPWELVPAGSLAS